MYDLHNPVSAHHSYNDSTPNDFAPNSPFDSTHNNVASSHPPLVSFDDTSTPFIYDDSATESLHGDNAACRVANPDSIIYCDCSPIHLNSEACRENSAKCLLPDYDCRRSIMLCGRGG